MEGGGNSPSLHRLVSSIENPFEYCRVCKSLLFDVLQRTSPFTSPRGRAAPGGFILEQSVLWMESTPICGGTEDSVRSQTSGKEQQSGGWI